MHIPDGYISPIMSLGAGVVTVPAWAVAVRKVQSVLNNRTVPLLAIFSAFTFTIMMFNIPVPGGTTAHAIGGTLIAVVLGMPAAIIGVSMALILQALFFGDGGVLAIFINCLNMGVILPIVGYLSYRVIAGRSPLLSIRRAWAAGIGAYIGITASAVAVAVELGLQPILFTENGRALYSPYGLDASLAAMLISHLFGAAIVEGLVTAFGVAYMQKRHPEYLTSLRTIFAGPEAVEGQTSRRPLGQIVGAASAVALIVLFAGGLIAGGGDIGHLFGTDWLQVNWGDVGMMLLLVAVLAAVLIPVTYFLLPRRIKGLAAGFMALAIIAPLGLIAPGFAYGEGSANDVHAAFGYIPKGLQDLSSFFSAPFSGYSVAGAGQASEPLWQTAIGYEISGILGIMLVGGIVWSIAALLRKRAPVPRLDPKKDSAS